MKCNLESPSQFCGVNFVERKKVSVWSLIERFSKKQEAAVEHEEYERCPGTTTRNLLRDRNVLGRWYLSVGNGTLTKLRLGSREFVVKSRSERGAQAEFCRVPL